MRYRALASDFDGTLARDGHVEPSTLAAVRRWRASGRRFILVTGRELGELQATFPGVDACDAVVAENGGLLYWPDSRREEALAGPPPAELVAEMTRQGVAPFSVGRVIFATWRPHEIIIRQTIRRLGIDYDVVFNKRAVMVLPAGVNKATGLAAALVRWQLAPEAVVGVGDAENDRAFLDACGLAAAVGNALPALKTHCDVVTQADHGGGVVELIERILGDEPALPDNPGPTLAVRRAND